MFDTAALLLGNATKPAAHFPGPVTSPVTLVPPVGHPLAAPEDTVVRVTGRLSSPVGGSTASFPSVPAGVPDADGVGVEVEVGVGVVPGAGVGVGVAPGAKVGIGVGDAVVAGVGVVVGMAVVVGMGVIVGVGVGVSVSASGAVVGP